MKSLSVPSHLQLRKEPKQQRTRELLNKISQSTISLIEEQGYFALNTNAIAEHAGIYVNSLYEFFPNKESILYRIADQWLASLRLVCEEFSKPEKLELEWRTFFTEMMSEVFSQEEYHDNSKALKGLWELVPEFTALDEYHRQYLFNFFMQNFKRFGAKGDDDELKLIAQYMIILEEGMSASAWRLNQSQRKDLWKRHMNTVLDQLEPLFD